MNVEYKVYDFQNTKPLTVNKTYTYTYNSDKYWMDGLIIADLSMPYSDDLPDKVYSIYAWNREASDRDLINLLDYRKSTSRNEVMVEVVGGVHGIDKKTNYSSQILDRNDYGSKLGSNFKEDNICKQYLNNGRWNFCQYWDISIEDDVRTFNKCYKGWGDIIFPMCFGVGTRLFRDYTDKSKAQYILKQDYTFEKVTLSG
jgi:hypothetical protein